MSDWRETKNKARRAVHETMRVAALYVVPNPAFVDDTSTPDECKYITQEVSPRVHYQFKALGDLKGTSFHYAEKQEVAPQIIFWRDELSDPIAGAIVSVSESEMYRIDNVMPPDGVTITCEVVRVPKRQMEGVPYPGG